MTFGPVQTESDAYEPTVEDAQVGSEVKPTVLRSKGNLTRVLLFFNNERLLLVDNK